MSGILPVAAMVAVLLGALWLVFVGAVCGIAPQRAQRGLAQMGANWQVQLGEHIPRAIVGAAMIVHAAESAAPQLFTIGGYFLVASSALILILPRRWHHDYASWWAARIPLLAYRLLAIPVIAAGVLLALATLSLSMPGIS
ncbi:hypothetical protein [Qipengyuania sp. ASV99]|uniref:hypothetical protein n=1 Tax=Qipengyuania sp. ASV99 TaxID=3399681 RepID=UPI003A4C6D7C